MTTDTSFALLVLLILAIAFTIMGFAFKRALLFILAAGGWIANLMFTYYNLAVLGLEIWNLLMFVFLMCILAMLAMPVIMKRQSMKPVEEVKQEKYAHIKRLRDRIEEVRSFRGR